ncbi:MAG: VOC family protein [Undibacterium sp.]|nr:VOC family protein [Opitutaceae bacterium]
MSTPAPLAINYLEFTTRDLTAAKTFLAAAFSWTFTDYGPDYAAFADAGLNGGLRADPAAPLVGNVLTVLFAADLEAALSRVNAADGATITAAPYEFPGGRRFEFTAPGGLMLAVWSDHRADRSKIT